MDTLVLVDVTDAHGMMLSRQRFMLQYPGAPVVIGRDLACDVVLNDPYVAARHAQLSLVEDGTVRLDDLGTINGLIAGDERVRHAVIAGLDGAQVQVGHSHLRLRIGTDRLAPERRDRESLRSGVRDYVTAGVGALACAGFALLMGWIAAPDDVSNAVVNNLLRGGAVLVAWFAGWVVLGRAVRSRWQWSGNAALTLGAAALALWLSWGTDVAVFASGNGRFQPVGVVLMLALAASALYLQLRRATRLRRRWAMAVATVLPLIALTGHFWLQQLSAADVNRITPPAAVFPPDWSRQPGVRLDRFFDDALDLRDAADNS